MVRVPMNFAALRSPNCQRCQPAKGDGTMPKRDVAPIGAPCWIDLFTHEPDRIRGFYGELFGWTSEDAGPDYGGYINFAKDGIAVAGCMRNDGASGAPDAW